MKDFGLVTVIIPVYNRAKLVQATIKSIINQTYKNVEIILCNDASTDMSWEVLQKFKRRFPNMVKICKLSKNGGSSSCRNAAYQLIDPNSQYVLPHDSDDISYPDKIEKMLEYLVQHPELDAIGCLGEYIDESGKKMNKQPKVYLKYEDILKSFHEVNHFLTGGVLIRREAFDKVQPYIGRNYDDYDFWCRFLKCGLRVENMSYVGLGVRRHPARKSDTADKSQRSIRIQEIRDDYVRFLNKKVDNKWDIDVKNNNIRSKQYNVGLLIIATNKYIDMAVNLIKSANKYFLTNHNVTYFIFTNHDESTLNIPAKNYVIIPQEHSPWPGPTLLRYSMFHNAHRRFRGMDYLYYIDADMKFVSSVGTEILGELVVTDHPGFYNKDVSSYTYERNQIRSSAYIAPNEGTKYFIGSFQGGAKSKYIDMCRELSRNIDKDLAQQIIAVWHDESHLNRYCINHKPTKILPPYYSYPQSSANVRLLPGEPKIIALKKDHFQIRDHKSEKDFLDFYNKKTNRLPLEDLKLNFDSKIIKFNVQTGDIAKFKANLKDVTFCIPVTIDSRDRIRNLSLVIGFLHEHFNTNILVGELDTSKKLELSDKFQYKFFKNTENFFHRTKLLNELFKLSTTPYVVNYDADVLAHPMQYLQCTALLRNNKIDMVYPFDGNFLDINGESIKLLNKQRDVSVVNSVDITVMNDNLKNPSFGGAIFFNKKVLMQGGMENENFKSWGREDLERIFRFLTLGYRVGRLSNCPLYHLHHQRLKDSTSKHSFYKKNVEEFDKIKNMNKDQLKKYVKTWEWL